MRVLHAVVGHGLPRYFVNAVASVRAAAAEDELVVIDNGTNDPRLTAKLRQLCDPDPQVELITRTSNDTSVNRKVGELYAAYNIVFDVARRGGYDLVHLIQGDMQLLWWDSEIVEKAGDLFAVHRDCVNICTQFLSRDRRLAGELDLPKNGELMLRWYGLTDTGLYHLRRWDDLGMSFGASERDHAGEALAMGLKVICHPWPAVAPIPWPAVIRDGKRRGAEIVTKQPFLLRPLSIAEVSAVKQAVSRTWLEDVCVPWGWTCATPMWVTEINALDYWALRRRAMIESGRLRDLFPAFERRGLTRLQGLAPSLLVRHRPYILRLWCLLPIREGWRSRRQLAARCQSRLRLLSDRSRRGQ